MKKIMNMIMAGMLALFAGSSANAFFPSRDECKAAFDKSAAWIAVSIGGYVLAKGGQCEPVADLCLLSGGLGCAGFIASGVGLAGYASGEHARTGVYNLGRRLTYKATDVAYNGICGAADLGKKAVVGTVTGVASVGKTVTVGTVKGGLNATKYVARKAGEHPAGATAVVVGAGSFAAALAIMHHKQMFNQDGWR